MRFPFSSTVAVAHRGAHGPGYPENSLAAVGRAVELRLPAVEFDVGSLADGTLVVHHDPHLPVGGRRVPLGGLSWEQAAAAGLERVEPYLELLAGHDLLILFDYKGVGGGERIGRLLRSYGLVERTVVCSTNRAALLNAKQADRGVITGVSVSFDSARDVVQGDRLDIEGLGAMMRAVEADAITLDHRLASRATAHRVRSGRWGLFLWTVGDAARDAAAYRLLLGLAPDGITTDDVVGLGYRPAAGGQSESSSPTTSDTDPRM